MRAALAARVEVEGDRSGWMSPALQDGDFPLGESEGRAHHTQPEGRRRRRLRRGLCPQQEHNGAAGSRGELQSPQHGIRDRARLGHDHGATRARS